MKDQLSPYEMAQLQKERDERVELPADDNFHSPETFKRDAGLEEWIDERAKLEPMSDEELEDMRMRAEANVAAYAIAMQKQRLTIQIADWKMRADINEPWVQEQLGLLEMRLEALAKL